MLRNVNFHSSIKCVRKVKKEEKNWYRAFRNNTKNNNYTLKMALQKSPAEMDKKAENMDQATLEESRNQTEGFEQIKFRHTLNERVRVRREQRHVQKQTR